ncbi:hypothetical protein LPJ56_001792 [Coemansia sp. RSA 2599]|nr:hypothetical protein LPJ56_001792 [Coemansia sp. RSA 2599]
MAMLHSVRQKIVRIQQKLQTENTSLYKLVSDWLEQIEGYVEINKAGSKERSNQAVSAIADRITHVELLYGLTTKLYHMSDEALMIALKTTKP